ncbi:CRISPR-associated endonuclease Cas1 [Megamonas funiformis]|uniref:CRISPR-associated endonuclease Cas1 n=1 Tax=Megamonas funiformis TaxID=437897 RepID=UPI00195B22E5|nr:CRISPR-associated endonuclease Cas1 [Megamonas funiformis]MBM6726850.1 CRISPR-associated endonuclease Cas1 [Megamonas funiformis]
MASIYINENGAYLHKKGGRLIIEKDDIIIKEIPLELVEDITVVNTTQISSALITECFAKDIPIFWISSSGNLLGSLYSPKNIDIFKHKQQFELLSDKNFYFQLAQNTVYAKIHNQITLLRRYNRNLKIDKVTELINYIKNVQKNIQYTTDFNELLGYEGLSSRTYFSALGLICPKPFQFSKRSKQPPLDPFNAMLSFGYNILFNEILSAVISTGLHPYIGFFHQLAKGHPALVSDLIEEWRAIIIDSLVMNLIKRNSITIDMFDKNKKSCYLNADGKKIFLNAYNKKLQTENKYIEGTYTYRQSINLQCKNYARVIINKDISLYTPIKLR